MVVVQENDFGELRFGQVDRTQNLGQFFETTHHENVARRLLQELQHRTQVRLTERHHKAPLTEGVG